MPISSEWNNYFKIEEKHLTKSAINRLKIAVIAAVPIIPIIVAPDLTSSDSHQVWSLVVTLTSVATFIAMLYVLLNPLSNTLIQRDKDLDEWGVSHKLAAQSFAYRITVGLLSTFWVVAIISSYFSSVSSFKLSVSVYDIGDLMVSIMFFLWLTSTAHIAWTIRPIAMEDGLPIREDKAVVTAREQKVEAAIIITVVFLVLLSVCAGLFAWGWMDAHNAAGH